MFYIVYFITIIFWLPTSFLLYISEHHLTSNKKDIKSEDHTIYFHLFISVTHLYRTLCMFRYLMHEQRLENAADAHYKVLWKSYLNHSYQYVLHLPVKVMAENVWGIRKILSCILFSLNIFPSLETLKFILTQLVILKSLSTRYPSVHTPCDSLRVRGVGV